MNKRKQQQEELHRRPKLKQLGLLSQNLFWNKSLQEILFWDQHNRGPVLWIWFWKIQIWQTDKAINALKESREPHTPVPVSKVFFANMFFLCFQAHWLGLILLNRCPWLAYSQGFWKYSFVNFKTTCCYLYACRHLYAYRQRIYCYCSGKVCGIPSQR